MPIHPSIHPFVYLSIFLSVPVCWGYILYWFLYLSLYPISPVPTDLVGWHPNW